MIPQKLQGHGLALVYQSLFSVILWVKHSHSYFAEGQAGARSLTCHTTCGPCLQRTAARRCPGVTLTGTSWDPSVFTEIAKAQSSKPRKRGLGSGILLVSPYRKEAPLPLHGTTPSAELQTPEGWTCSPHQGTSGSIKLVRPTKSKSGFYGNIQEPVNPPSGNASYTHPLRGLSLKTKYLSLKTTT